jgi:ABC-type antimicrobial peptide transport system permease subunit
MDTILSGSVAQSRFRTLLMGLFGASALLLATIGIYGVLAYSVSTRLHEIGIRMALGAQAMDVLTLVVRQGMLMALVGIVLGLLGALALTRVLSGLLFQIKATDPVTFTGVALLLALVALFACWYPARRATKVSPMAALRYE